MRERLERRRGCYADSNVEANAGAGGAKFSVDDDGTQVWPYCKLAWGAGGTRTEVAAGAASVPIQDGGNSITVDGSLTTLTTLTSITNVVHVDDNSGSLTVDNGGTFAVQNNSNGKTMKTASGTLTADTDVIAAVSTKRIKVYAYSIITVGTNANAAIFKSNGTGGTELWRFLIQGATGSPMGINLAVAPPGFLFATVAGEKLTLDVGNADTLHYSLAYWDDDAT